MPAVTVYDVAKRANVGIATVSRVFNGNPVVSEATRQRVLRAAQELGYVPDAAAQALASRRSKIIGLVLTRDPHHIASDAFLNQILDNLINEVRKHGMRLLLDIVEDLHHRETYLQLVKSKRIDGIIFSGPRFDDQALRGLEEEGFPTVLMGQLPGTRLCSVDVDNRAAARMAVAYLFNIGYKSIACITNAPPSYTAAAERLHGYRDALAEAGLEYDERLVRFGDFDLESGYLQMISFLDEAPHPEAVFVASDVVAFGAMAAIRERGLRIPQDIALVGFDDVPLARYVDPPLTTVHLPTVELARRSSEMLIELIAGKCPEPCQVLLETDLVVRESCGANWIERSTS